VTSGRVVGIVALCAAAAVAAIVGGTLLLSRHERTSGPVQKGRPPLQLELGVRRDPEAVALSRAERLLDTGGNATQAAAIFGRYHSPEAQLGLAFSRWTGPSSLAAVQSVAARYPDLPVVLLNLGFAEYWAGGQARAVASWQQTARAFPDSPYAVDALDALNPAVVPGLPYIVVDPAAVPAKARRALEAGVQAWDLKHVVTARRLLDVAAALAPDAPETLVAASVARYSPADPKASFPTLGPLSGRFPQASIVRLHLGLLLIWTHQLAKAKEQFRLAAAAQPRSIYAKQAQKLLAALGKS
jgi:hypothetical protein